MGGSGAVDELAYGVLSSFLAVALTELYFLVRRRWRLRPLRVVLPVMDGRLTVVCPAQPNPLPGGAPLMTIDSAIELGLITEAAKKLGTRVEARSADADLTVSSPGVVSLGGPLVNSLTGQLLSDYCPGFHRIGGISPDPVTYVFGTMQFAMDGVQTLWVLAKLPSAVTGRTDGTLIVFGEYGQDTMSAVLFMLEHTRQVEDYVKKNAGALFLVARRDNRLSFRSVPTQLIDLTEEVFAPVPP